MAAAAAEGVPELAAALGPGDFGTPPGVLHDAAVAHPHAVGEARAERLHDRLLGGEALRQEAHRARLGARDTLEVADFLGHQDALDEVPPEALVSPGDAL